MNHDARWVLPLGAAAADGWDLAVTDARPDWQHTSLRVATLTPASSGSGSRVLEGGDWEYVVVPLSGAAHVTATTADGTTHEAELAGRTDVFAGPTDVAYVPAGSRITVRPSAGAARVALAGALTRGGSGAAGRAFRHLPAAQVPVERRGAGSASREVRNFGLPGVLDADAIIACEVVTPAGNWSSWPPHKHDVERPGEETALEEIYYFETRSTDPRGTDPVGYQRVYASGADRPIDVLAEVRTGDVVLVPHGWHGPSIAAPDAHLYYLNVMAGPGPERAWLICDDPAHAQVRDTWREQPFDPRLPLTRPASGETV
ncbi:5-deoxy-glucuronate isomerase [Streptomyces sp. NBC_01190]|uniref:5-deoxy-glucuronate isomerase n=1 Tax=Streptomyces sp. NBC_01190 TaxID=2903767 RepID=UPI003868E3FC|nr:5-deoxy-glucuronate isomerase [Streptomyces sp. NBC_01190]